MDLEQNQQHDVAICSSNGEPCKLRVEFAITPFPRSIYVIKFLSTKRLLSEIQRRTKNYSKHILLILYDSCISCVKYKYTSDLPKITRKKFIRAEKISFLLIILFFLLV